MSRQTLRRRGYNLSASLVALAIYLAIIGLGIYLAWPA